MTVNESIYQYYHQQHSTIIKSYAEFAECPDSELVHKLRLGIKKLKAIDFLAGYLPTYNNNLKVNYSVELKSLFKIAGKLRDIQVQIELLLSYEGKANTSLSEFRKWLIKDERKRMNRLSEVWQSQIMTDENPVNSNKSLELFRNTKDEDILLSACRALSELFNTARKLSYNKISNDDLHKIRIVTKQMRYIYSTVRHGCEDFVFEKISVETLREIEAAVGYWHDCLMRMELFDKFNSKLTEDGFEINEEFKVHAKAFKKELCTAYREACKLSAIVYKK